MNCFGGNGAGMYFIMKYWMCWLCWEVISAMYFKLSLRNARRQARDYLVYFLTMTFVTALMFAFNSLIFTKDIEEMFEVAGLVFSEEIKTLSETLEMLPVVIVLASIVVIGIMGWLVSYMNSVK